MSFSKNALAERTMSSYPVSIGTALALESIQVGPNPVYDANREIPEKVNLDDYDEYWFNLMTLFRNIVGSVSKEGYNALMPLDIADIIEQEVDIIRTIIRELSNGKCRVIFYASDYSGLNSEFPFASLRVDSTEKQKIYTSLLTTSLGKYFKSQIKQEDLIHTKLWLKPKKIGKALITTHFALDLLNHTGFESLHLLESHTGILKKKNQWHTKFHNGKTLVRIPFNRAFLQIFGDNQTFHPMDRKLRESILEVSEKYEWNWSTTKDRILLSINDIANPYFKAIIKDMGF